MEIAWGNGVSPPVNAVNVSDSGDTCNSGEPAANVTVYCWLAVKPRLSVTTTVNVKVPMAVGVPERNPEFKMPMPGGWLPVMVNTYGGDPPLTEIACE